ncbi:MAG TPA: hypothetical protein VL944_03055 [Candidatus Acidoferrum sp.]|nr:hypothetical protein [Candidatus Acidoferrum sp.]
MPSSYKGIVTGLRRSHDSKNNLYTILSSRAISAKSKFVLELGDVVTVKEIDEKEQTISSVEVNGRYERADYERELSKKLEKLSIGRNAERIKKSYKREPYYETVERMSGALQKAAASLFRSYISGAPILVRFHHDGDGSSGAVSLHRALSAIDKKFSMFGRSVSWIMNRGIDYNSTSIYSDLVELRNYESVELPVVLILDFGTAPGSAVPIAESRGKFKLIMLDHHPVYEGFPMEKVDHYINPWNYGSGTDFTAGLLTSVFAEMLCKVNTKDMRAASLISDFSSFADRSSKPDQRTAVILDYLTNVAGRYDSKIAKLTPSYIDNVLKDKGESDSLFYEASSSMNEMLDLGMRGVKPHRCRDGINAFVLDFDALPRSSSGYPLPGRFSSRLQEKLEEMNGSKTMTILYYGGYVTLRMSKKISGTVKILDLIKRLEDTSDYVESGGGHNEAASIRVIDNHSKEIVDIILRELRPD